MSIKSTPRFMGYRHYMPIENVNRANPIFIHEILFVHSSWLIGELELCVDDVTLKVFLFHKFEAWRVP